MDVDASGSECTAKVEFSDVEVGHLKSNDRDIGVRLSTPRSRFPTKRSSSAVRAWVKAPGSGEPLGANITQQDAVGGGSSTGATASTFCYHRIKNNNP